MLLTAVSAITPPLGAAIANSVTTSSNIGRIRSTTTFTFWPIDGPTFRRSRDYPG
jgi:hypothetical protein